MNILMPQLGETVTEGKIVTWFKSVGDSIVAGDALFEIDTDKTAMEVPSMSAGVLQQILFQVGETALVGQTVAVIAVDGEAPTANQAEAVVAAPDKTAPAGAPPPSVPGHATAPQARDIDPFNAVKSPEKNFGSATLADGVKVTPLARRLAALNDVDLTRVRGSGPRGRVVAKDVTDAASRPATGAANGAIASGAGVDQVKALYANVPYREVPLDGMRRTIAKRLLESKQTIPHFYLTVDVSIEKLLKLRSEINAAAASKVSINDFVVKAFALALHRTPGANAVWAEDRVLQFDRVDVGVAVAVEGGLFTPVIRGAEGKSLSAISAEIKDFAARAKDKKLKPDEYLGGAAAVSNLGMYGVRQFSAIVNPPHATILAVGAGERRPVEGADGSVGFESQMTVTLSCDHRVVDGALGGELLAAFKVIIEAPLSALV